MDYYTVLLMLKPGLLIANQIRDLCYSYDYQFNWTRAQAIRILPFGQALQSSLLLPGALL